MVGFVDGRIVLATISLAIGAHILYRLICKRRKKDNDQSEMEDTDEKDYNGIGNQISMSSVVSDSSLTGKKITGALPQKDANPQLVEPLIPQPLSSVPSEATSASSIHARQDNTIPSLPPTPNTTQDHQDPSSNSVENSRHLAPQTTILTRPMDTQATLRAPAPPSGTSTREPLTEAGTLSVPQAPIPTPTPTPIRLQVLKGPMQNAEVYGDRSCTNIYIGRHFSNQLVLQDEEVSGQHVQVFWESSTGQSDRQGGGCWFIKDVGSLNGTRISSDQGQQMPINRDHRIPGPQFSLTNGTIIYIGNSEIRFTTDQATTTPSGSGNAGEGSLPTKRPYIRVPRTSSDDSSGAGSAIDFATPPRTVPTVQKGEHQDMRISVARLSMLGQDHARCQKGNEDVAFWNIPLQDREHTALIALADGHCGEAASNQVRSSFPAILSAHLPPTADLINKLDSVFVSTRPGRRDVAMEQDNGEDEEGRGGFGCQTELYRSFKELDKSIESNDGCTFTCILVCANEEGECLVQSANVGDSLAFIWMSQKSDGAGGDENTESSVPEERVHEGGGGGRVSTQYHVLTADHRVCNHMENTRLQQLGAPISHAGTRLVGLNLARSIGDRELKDAGFGLIAIPHVSSVYKIPVDVEAVLVVASDGLWDVVGVEQVVGVVEEVVSGQGREGKAQIAETLAQKLVESALQGKSRDDVSVVVSYIGAKEAS